MCINSHRATTHFQNAVADIDPRDNGAANYEIRRYQKAMRALWVFQSYLDDMDAPRRDMPAPRKMTARESAIERANIKRLNAKNPAHNRPFK